MDRLRRIPGGWLRVAGGAWGRSGRTLPPAARRDALRAVVRFMHARPWAAPTGRYFGYRELLATLAKETLGFEGEVLLVHGDTHRFPVDSPLRDSATGAPVANFPRGEVVG